MEAIADALVYAVVFTNLRAGAEEDADDDVRALESIAGFLSSASEKEKTALAAAANRALQAERDGSNRAEFLNDFARWMEDMFGEDWSGNERRRH